MKNVLTAITMVLVAASAALAQPARPSAAAAEEEARARNQVFYMESLLERAVDQGANNLRSRVQRIMPDVMLVSGAAEVRGVRLDGYGVFFDVAVPALRRSLAWSLRMNVDNGSAATESLQTLRAWVESQTDARMKENLAQAIDRLERQVGVRPRVSPAGMERAGPPPRGTVSAATVDPMPPAARPNQPPATSAADEAILADPDSAYTSAVKSALIDVMLEHSQSLRIGPDQWLTVAAREQRDRMLPGDPSEVMTLIFRVKGKDLADYRADRITREEALKRVEITEF